MKFNFSIKGVTSQMANIEDVSITVEYSAEEIVAVGDVWQKVIPTIIAAVEKQQQRDDVRMQNACDDAAKFNAEFPDVSAELKQ